VRLEGRASGLDVIIITLAAAAAGGAGDVMPRGDRRAGDDRRAVAADRAAGVRMTLVVGAKGFSTFAKSGSGSGSGSGSAAAGVATVAAGAAVDVATVGCLAVLAVAALAVAVAAGGDVETPTNDFVRALPLLEARVVAFLASSFSSSCALSSLAAAAASSSAVTVGTAVHGPSCCA
jgi:hypothetical protein